MRPPNSVVVLVARTPRGCVPRWERGVEALPSRGGNGENASHTAGPAGTRVGGQGLTQNEAGSARDQLGELLRSPYDLAGGLLGVEALDGHDTHAAFQRGPR